MTSSRRWYFSVTHLIGDCAIELLERIKHLFDVPNITFVLSLDKKQLEASTAAVHEA